MFKFLIVQKDEIKILNSVVAFSFCLCSTRDEKLVFFCLSHVFRPYCFKLYLSVTKEIKNNYVILVHSQSSMNFYV